MSQANQRPERVLAIYPMWKGVCYAVSEGPTTLLDWGLAKLYANVDEEFMTRVEGLVERYRPDVLALEDPGDSRRRAVARRRIEQARLYAAGRKLAVVQIAWSAILGYFGKQHSRDVALSLAQAFPQLEQSVPAPRRVWDSENVWHSLFKAIAIAVVVGTDLVT